MLLHSQETHSIPLTQFILYLRASTETVCSGRGHPQRRILAINRERLIEIPNRSDVTNYPVLCQELGCEGPGCISHHLVHIATVLHSIVALVFVHYRETLEVVGQLITADWRNRQRTQSEALTPMIYNKRTLPTLCWTWQCQQLTEAGVSNPALPATKHKEQGALQDTKLLSNSGQAAWRISAQAGDPHPKPLKSSELSTLIKKTS